MVTPPNSMPKRVSVTISQTTVDYLERLSRLGLHGQTLSQVVLNLTEAGIRNAVEKGLISLDGHNTKAEMLQYVLENNRSRILWYVNIVLSALEDALTYDPQKRHNRVPELWIDDADYLSELKRLTDELRRLNGLLEKSVLNKHTTRVAINVSKHANTFMHHLSKTGGKGAAVLLLGSLGTLLYELNGGSQLAMQDLWKLFGNLK